MPISFGLTSNLSISQNLSVGGSAAVAAGLTLSDTTASTLLYGNAGKVVASVTLASNLSLTSGTLALATALTSINSVTAASATNLTLSGGSSGASLVLGSGVNGNININPKGAGTVLLGSAGLSNTYNLSVFGSSATNLVGVGADGSIGLVGAFSAGGSSRTLAINPAGGNLLVGTTTDMSGVTGGVKIASTEASTGLGTGALQVAGGGYFGAASVFGSTLSASGTVTSTVASGGSAFSANSAGSLYGLTISRGATTNYGGIRFSTSGNEKWFVGMRELSDDHFRFFAGVLGADALAINNTTGATTFAGVTILKNYTVATLPTASSYTYGTAFVSDATNAAGTGGGTAPTGGGSVKRMVYSDGSAWLLIQ